MMKVVSCPGIHELNDFVLGLLAEEQSQSIEEHLLHCTNCTRQLAENPDSDPLIEALRQQRIQPAYPHTREIEPIQQRLHASYQQISTRVAVQREEVTTLSGSVVEGAATLLNGQSRQSEEAPERINHYVLKKELGSGGTGVVYQAWDEKLGRYVALKIILDRRLWNAQHAERFTSEAATLARLAHPQIVHIYEVGEIQGRPYLVLEYLPGGDLASRLQGQPQYHEDCAQMVMLLARAAHHAHTQGVIHRDLKPANILIETPAAVEGQQTTRPLEKLSIKIADFGLAKRMEVPGVTETGVVLGTPGYMAPESLRFSQEKFQQDPTIDVYSLGAILYEMLTGRPPFRGETAAETLVQVQTDIPLPLRKLRPGLSRDLETICMHCLEKEPRLRYPTAQHLADDLQRFLKHEPISVHPANVIERTIKWSKRRPALAALMLLLVISVALLAAGAIVYERRLQAELKKTAAERDRADVSYRSARESLERMLAKLDDPRRANVPQLQALRREQQQEILQFLASVTGNTSDDPPVMRDVAKALYTSGRLRIVIGEAEQARLDLQRSIALLTELLQRSPDDVSLKAELAGNHQAMAVTYQMGPESLPWNEKALAIHQALASERTDDHERQRMLAMSLHNLGSNYLTMSKLEEAENYLKQSMKVLEQLPEQASKALQIEIAETEANLGLVYQGQKKPGLADEYYARALKRFESIHQDDPQHLRVLLSLCGLRVNRANALAVAGKTDQALGLLEANHRELRSLLQREPEFSDAKGRLFETQGSRGNLLGGLKRHREAAEAFVDVANLAAPGEGDYYRLFQASNLAYAGDYRASLEACSRAGNYARLNADQKAYLAMCYCLNAAAITKDAALSSTEQADLLKKCKAGAIQWLDQAYQQKRPAEWSQFLLSLTLEDFWKPVRQYQPAWEWVQQHPTKR